MDEPNCTATVASLLSELVQNDARLHGVAAVVTGSDASANPAPEARRLQALGVSWDWVAVRLTPHSFWDLHVGVLPASGGAVGFNVGLHWSTSVDQAVRPWALALLPESRLSFSAAAQEHQLTLSEGDSRSVFAVRPAAEAATRIAALAATVVPPEPEPAGYSAQTLTNTNANGRNGQTCASTA